MWRLFKAVIVLSTFASGAHADEHPSLKGRNDTLCNLVANDNWKSFQQSLRFFDINTSQALSHMRCSFRDGYGRERVNTVLYLMAIYKARGGSFMWNVISHLEANNEIDMLVPLVTGLEANEDIFGEIDEAKMTSMNNENVVEELEEMKRALCLTIRKHKIADLKPLYMRRCVK
jgi:hypothetical protein